jgi:hypothetical protein
MDCSYSRTSISGTDLSGRKPESIGKINAATKVQSNFDKRDSLKRENALKVLEKQMQLLRYSRTSMSGTASSGREPNRIGNLTAATQVQSNSISGAALSRIKPNSIEI